MRTLQLHIISIPEGVYKKKKKYCYMGDGDSHSFYTHTRQLNLTQRIPQQVS